MELKNRIIKKEIKNLLFFTITCDLFHFIIPGNCQKILNTLAGESPTFILKFNLVK